MITAGVDEAGRGPLAGPVVAAAVILDPTNPIEGLMDSKQLTEAKREKLAIEIKANALAFAVAEASIEDIERINILQASLLAMKRAVEKLSLKPTEVLVDGNQAPQLDVTTITIIKGDQTEACISAASILAKVHRDNLMKAYDETFPGYGFAGHKGYHTKQHIEALDELGPCAIHRVTFEPVRSRLALPV